MYNFKLICADTDSITICKQDGSIFTEDETDKLTEELNSLYESGIHWEFEFNYPKMIVLKAKNYIMQDENGKVKIKGSALKASTKSPALKQFIKDLINSMLDDKENFKEIYESYVKEALNVSDIKRWSSRKTITDKVTNAKRTNEQKVKDIIEETEYVEGDKIYTFFLPNGNLELVENFNGVYDKAKLLEQIYKTALVFDSVLNTEELFTNYSLAKYFNELCPEQAVLKKQLNAKKRKEALVRKALKESEESVNIKTNDNDVFQTM